MGSRFAAGLNACGQSWQLLVGTPRPFHAVRIHVQSTVARNPRVEKFECFPVSVLEISRIKNKSLLGSNARISRFLLGELGAARRTHRWLLKEACSVFRSLSLLLYARLRPPTFSKRVPSRFGSRSASSPFRHLVASMFIKVPHATLRCILAWLPEVPGVTEPFRYHIYGQSPYHDSGFQSV